MNDKRMIEVLDGLISHVEVIKQGLLIPDKPKPDVKPAEWREGDLAVAYDAISDIYLLFRIESFDSEVGGWYGRFILSGNTTIYLPRQISIPTPEQLLVEYNGHQCLVWETDGGYIGVRWARGEDDYVLYDNPEQVFLIPKELMARCISHDQIVRHYGGEIKYPEGK